jgi:hypothetical protein
VGPIVRLCILFIVVRVYWTHMLFLTQNHCLLDHDTDSIFNLSSVLKKIFSIFKNIILYKCPFKLLNRPMYFHEIWKETYDTGDHSNFTIK